MIILSILDFLYMSIKLNIHHNINKTLNLIKLVQFFLIKKIIVIVKSTYFCIIWILLINI